MGNVKGHAIISCKNYLQKRYSDNDIKKLKDVLGENNYNVLLNAKADNSYSLNDFIEINKAICSVFGNNSTDIIKEVGRQSATDAVRGVFKAFFKFGSPQFILKICTEIFNKYYDTGKLIYIEESSSKTSVLAELREFQIDNKADMKYICLRIEGWIERSLEISAGKAMKTKQIKCLSDGDGCCSFLSEWQS